MPKLVNRPPKLRRHARNQGVVTIGGVDYYLGYWKKGSKAPAKVRQAYSRILAEVWEREGEAPLPDKTLVTIEEVAASYWTYAKKYYRKNGQPTSELGNVKCALKPLRQLWGGVKAVDFGPLKLQALRDHIARTENLTRGVINRRIARVKYMLKWAKNNETIPASVYDSIRDVEGLRRGQANVREPKAVEPVADAVVQATLPLLPEIVADMVRFQRLTGCRPGEVCLLRPVDVDRSSDVWIYRPWTHKTEHHEKDRVILIGPKAQAILTKYLLRETETYCFRPAEQQRKRFAQQREQVKHPESATGAERRAHSGLNPHYSPNSYRVAVYRAVKKANKKRKRNDQLPDWSPNQLRHTAATEIRKVFGSIDAAQVILGHSRLNTTEVYAEKNIQQAREIMLKIG